MRTMCYRSGKEAKHDLKRLLGSARFAFPLIMGRSSPLARLLTVLALSLLFHPGVANLTSVRSLSLEESLQRAQAENPLLLIQRARTARAKALKRQSLQGMTPTVSVDATQLRWDTSVLEGVPFIEPGLPPLVTRQDFGPVEGRIAGVQLVQPLFNLGAWEARRQADRQVKAARLTLSRASDEVALTVVETYFGAVTAEQRVEAERRALRTAERALRQAEGASDEGLVAPVDVLRARTRVREMKARVAAAKSQVIGAHALLRQILALEDLPDLVLTDSVPE
ncbi:MAG TPA: TolC family protein, partial [Opitutales bacterium]|nr:TolC family protein [Opitutales bacterium]